MKRETEPAAGDRIVAPSRASRSAPLVYEINTRCWLNALSTTRGARITLGAVPDSEFANWRRLGFTHIWLMGVWTTGPRSREIARGTADLRRFGEAQLPDFKPTDIAGSPYSIAEYRVPEELGGDAGLQEFRRKLREHGMKLILDFVPNHVGLDHRWLDERPELFVQSPNARPGTFAREQRGGVRHIAHGRDPHFLPWTDTAQLDYRLPELRALMQDELLDVADRCDGVRCDMAMLVLNDVFEKTWAAFPDVGVDVRRLHSIAETEVRASLRRHLHQDEGEFWIDAIAATKRAHPDFLFLAEAYWGLEARLQSLGFDYTYDKEIYDDIVRRNPAGVQRRLLESEAHFISASAHFLENHDEPRVAALFTPAEHRAAALLTLGLPGMRLLHDGQLQGARIKVPVQLLRAPVEPRHPEIAEMYEQLLGALQTSAVGRGRAALLRPRDAWPGNPTAQNVVLVQWQREPAEFDLVAVNLAAHRSQCYAPLSSPALADFDWEMRDRLGTEAHERSGHDLAIQGFYLDLPAYGAQLFHCQPLKKR